MSLYEQFKNLNEIELFDKIKKFVDNQEEESYCLDFKRIESLNFLLKSQNKQKTKDELGRDISAMANADGGIIIYGINEEKANTKDEKTRAVGFTEGFDKNLFDKEQFINNVNTIISPSLPNIDIKCLKHSENDNKCIIVLLVPKTKNGAIMALGEHHRYFQRQGTENKPIPHYAVQDINNRIVHPQLELIFDKKEIYYLIHDQGNSELVIQSPIIKNTGNVIAKNVCLSIKYPQKVYQSIFYNYTKEFILGVEDNLSVSYLKIFDHPIFPEQQIKSIQNISTVQLNLNKSIYLEPSFREEYHSIEFILYADNSSPKVYKINICTKYNPVRHDKGKYIGKSEKRVNLVDMPDYIVKTNF